MKVNMIKEAIRRKRVPYLYYFFVIIVAFKIELINWRKDEKRDYICRF